MPISLLLDAERIQRDPHQPTKRIFGLPSGPFDLLAKSRISMNDSKLPGFVSIVDEKKGNNWGTIKFLSLTFNYFRLPSIPRNSLKLRDSHTFDPYRPNRMALELLLLPDGTQIHRLVTFAPWPFPTPRASERSRLFHRVALRTTFAPGCLRTCLVCHARHRE
jgi:hypothetical protein